jgi:hypothetical protein
VVWSICFVLIGLGNESASTLYAVSVSKKLKHEIWLAMTDIGEEKSPLYIFIYARMADGPGPVEKFF